MVGWSVPQCDDIMCVLCTVQEEESLESKLKRLLQKDEEVARALGRAPLIIPSSSLFVLLPLAFSLRATLPVSVS